MPNNINKESIELLKTIAIYWSLWWIWWIAHYLDQVRKWEKFKTWLFCINVFLSLWIWIVIQPLIPDALSEAMRFSLTSASWFLSYPILTFLESKWLQIILWKLWIKK